MLPEGCGVWTTYASLESKVELRMLLNFCHPGRIRMTMLLAGFAGAQRSMMTLSPPITACRVQLRRLVPGISSALQTYDMRWLGGQQQVLKSKNHLLTAFKGSMLAQALHCMTLLQNRIHGSHVPLRNTCVLSVGFAVCVRVHLSLSPCSRQQIGM